MTHVAILIDNELQERGQVVLARPPYNDTVETAHMPSLAVSAWCKEPTEDELLRALQLSTDRWVRVGSIMGDNENSSAIYRLEKR